MQRDCALRFAGRERLTSFSVEYKTGNQILFECSESFTKEELGRHAITPFSKTAQITPSLGAPVSSRTIRRHLAEGHLGSWRHLSVLTLSPTHRRLRLEWCCARGNLDCSGMELGRL
ncbi:HTH_Tnp_Tc3_2 domain-containing protein [Trichonephila clavipes]|nr:HTH_Tnp_Tc3_2 domain-containing protein [Trichonephila clavipes]